MLTVAVAEFAIGLAILVVTFRIRGTIAVEFPNCMKGRAPCCTPLFSPEYEVYFGIKGGTIRISLPKFGGFTEIKRFFHSATSRFDFLSQD